MKKTKGGKALAAPFKQGAELEEKMARLAVLGVELDLGSSLAAEVIMDEVGAVHEAVHSSDEDEEVVDKEFSEEEEDEEELDM